MVMQRMHVVSVPLHYFLISPKIIWLQSQRLLTNRKIRHSSIICTQSTLLWWTDCESQFSTSWDIRRNTAVFWPCSHMISVNSGVTRPKFTKFLHDIDASFIICTQNASFGEKIAKISPADPETIVFRTIIKKGKKEKKKEINSNGMATRRWLQYVHLNFAAVSIS